MNKMYTMSSVEFASQESHEENNNNDLKNNMDPTTATINMSLSAETFLRAAISLKDRVRSGCGEPPTGTDPTLYKGLLGTAFICLRSYEITGDQHDLQLSAEIIDTCASVARDSTRHVTFLCGRGGIYALGAVVANHKGTITGVTSIWISFLSFVPIGIAILPSCRLECSLPAEDRDMAQEKALPVGPEEGGFGMSYDLLYGRAGFLWAALFINKCLGPETVPNELLMPIVDAVLAGGRAGASDNTACPLMYRWHGTRYWGAASGLAGILQVLLHFPLSIEDANDVKGTLRYMMINRFPHSGNYPVSEGNPRDKLVQWSHGAPGMAMTLCKASKVFPSDREFRDAAIEAGEVVWKNGLVKKVGLADGSAGNAYSFLSLYGLTGESIYEERAKAFASFLYHNAEKLVTEGHAGGAEYGYSLFQGLTGTACLWFDLVAPVNSKFPGYEL
ncbi:hypothetical protein JRO89_XS08G0247500 [Xanthoceras sorbifolium]|uniref:LanC-like protein GCL1 n=1 Tax=Xanthoceras sorbifolium TaxID=99658 RepID=A0ABQ8HRB2_9ROSI|nr:hypothetical protein JRO89_XS08G0247500 [Xanthoceras sorbifolium]